MGLHHQIHDQDNRQGIANVGTAEKERLRPLDVHDNISRYLFRISARNQVKSPEELANLIVHTCTTVFSDHDVPAEYRFFDFFERSIGTVSDRVARLLREFQVLATEGFADAEKHINIEEEAKLLVEIEDICDELTILKIVLDDQHSATTELSRQLDRLGGLPTGSISIRDNALRKSHMQRINTMEKITHKTTKTLRTLVDLKQKQASILQAVASVEYARRSVEQTEQSARQGRTLTLFTVVTIVFLPLSFLAAFFAIEIDVFPVDENGKLQLDYVLKYLLGISAGLSIPFIIIAFQVDRFAGWLSQLNQLTQSRNTRLLVFLGILLASVLGPVWTSRLESTVKVGVTVASVLLGLFGIISIGLIGLLLVKGSKRSDTSTTFSLTGSE
ncbi:hypothetical protein GGR57DRAFT_438674 [Xylariaceae sp. FL1272]|nr:hypothetical protein GGR57DRAFT_438674 [Xylariaceae sp. FL1272]